MSNYLSYEEQFKEILNNEEINKIENSELREIRMKYWNKRHTAFLDEHGIPDYEIGDIGKKLIEQEQKEIEKFK